MIAIRFLALRVLFGGIASAVRDPATRGLIGLTMAIILGASVFYMLVEGWGFLDALFFSTVTISTVGFGDLVPRTPLGRAFTILYIFAGIGIFVVTAASVAEHVIRRGKAEHKPGSGDGSGPPR